MDLKMFSPLDSGGARIVSPSSIESVDFLYVYVIVDDLII